jgi:nucleoside-diphosphate-sugar epimerase
MKVFVAGASGAIGRPLVAKLVENGHEVVAMTRSPHKVDALRAAGTTPVVADALDRDAVIAAVKVAQPDAIIHQLTAIGELSSPRKLDRDFKATNRLRIEGTDNLLAASWEVGVKRFVAQSFGGWPYKREGGPVKDEDDPLDTDPPAGMGETLAAIRHLERVVTDAGGIVLRYGGFYGPGTSLTTDGPMVKMIRGRKMPVVGNGAGVWSFIHIDDAAAATVAALERGEPGIYNVADDEPAAVKEWLPVLAEAVDAKPPRHVPTWLARIVGGEATVTAMTRLRGASNAKAKRELGWRPRYASWREGFKTGLA